MKPKHVDECEVKRGKAWVTLDIEDALRDRDEVMRCPECHGPVRPHKKYSDGARAHFEHLTAHTGCPLKPRTFSGQSSKHPDALS